MKQIINLCISEDLNSDVKITLEGCEDSIKKEEVEKLLTEQWKNYNDNNQKLFNIGIAAGSAIAGLGVVATAIVVKYCTPLLKKGCQFTFKKIKSGVEWLVDIEHLREFNYSCKVVDDCKKMIKQNEKK